MEVEVQSMHWSRNPLARLYVYCHLCIYRTASTFEALALSSIYHSFMIHRASYV